MNRRHFVKLSALSLLPFSACHSHDATDWELQVPVKIFSDRSAGHLMLKATTFPEVQAGSLPVAIVGGGLSGLAAAYQLRNSNFELFEASDILGGSSTARMHNGQWFSQGAHYDLTYPNYYGKEVLNMLEAIKVTRFNPDRNAWDFVDGQFVIPYEMETLCKNGRHYQTGVLPDIPATDQFLALMQQYQRKVMLPTRLIAQSLHHLDQQRFRNFLEAKMYLPEELVQAIDYQMLDDYGGDSSQVSALAGVFYYAGRDDGQGDFDTFSPPEGNYYFVKKITDFLPAENLKTRHLVSSIIPENGQFLLKVVDLAESITKVYTVQNIVYAAHKHALKYVFPAAYPLFSDTQYAPWAVINFVFQPGNLAMNAYWQNELLSPGSHFLGFVDSYAQFGHSGRHHILSAYYCFPESYRQQLAEMEQAPEGIVKEALRYIADFMEQDASELSASLEGVYIKLMGHAMPIPTPGYLFGDRKNNSIPGLHFAGVDCGRLPLLFEALDAGIMAAKSITQA